MAVPCDALTGIARASQLKDILVKLPSMSERNRDVFPA